jgi:hypothetical protein
VEAVDLTPPALKLVNHSAVVLSVDESRISEALQRCNGCDPSRIASRVPAVQRGFLLSTRGVESSAQASGYHQAEAKKSDQYYEWGRLGNGPHL